LPHSQAAHFLTSNRWTAIYQGAQAAYPYTIALFGKNGALIMPGLLIAGLVIAGMIGVWYFRSKADARFPAPESFIVLPDEKARVTRLDNGDYQIETAEPLTALFAGDHPDRIDVNRPIVPEPVESGVWRIPAEVVGSLPRPYFLAQFADGSTLKIAERILNVEGVANFRDIGGYAAADGKHIRWGLYYRTGMLGDLTESGRAMLRALNIRWVCDLRLLEEVSQNPDRVRDNPQIRYSHKPLTTPDDTRQRLQALLFDRSKLSQLMLESYTQVFLDDNAQLYGEVLRELLQPGALPAVVHCTAGKDRTGIATMLLMLALGVDEATIIADYSLSNYYFSTFRAYTADVVRKLRWFGLNANALTPLLVAQPDILRASLDYLRSKYGGADRYLKEAVGLTDAEIAALRALFLE
jgi:protein-tyrosine phosphatase